MKTTIIAASLFASFAAFASPTETQTFNFSAEKEASCSLNIVEDKAPLVFQIAALHDNANYAKAELVSDLATEATVTVTGEWDEVSAWGGHTPAVRVASVLMNTVDGDVGHSDDTTDFQHTYALNGKANQVNTFQMAVMTDEMTNVGKGSLNTTVQFTCE